MGRWIVVDIQPNGKGPQTAVVEVEVSHYAAEAATSLILGSDLGSGSAEYLLQRGHSRNEGACVRPNAFYTSHATTTF